MSQKILPKDWRLICDTCGHSEIISVWSLEEAQQEEGCNCGNPWCLGHCKLINISKYGNITDLWSEETIWHNIIREEFFQLPTFDREAYKTECIDEHKRIEEHYKQVRQRERANRISCPKCANPAVKEISTAGRVVSVFALGLASPTIGKTYKCLGCGHKW